MNAVSLPLLDRVDVASPCHARWEEMTGDERVRHCAACNFRVHNISAMTPEDAEALLRETVGERLCIRLFRRADGTIITQDCPVGLAKARARVRRAVVRVATLAGLVGATTGLAAAATNSDSWSNKVRLRALRPFSIVCEWIAPSAAPAPPNTQLLLGKRAYSPPPAQGGLLNAVRNLKPTSR